MSDAWTVMVETHTRAALEPNQAPEDMGLMIILPVLVWPHVFGHGAAYGNVICNSAGSTWSEIDSKLDEFAGSVNNGWWAPRGEMGTGIWVCSIETFAWASKLNLALCCGEAAVSRQQMQTLPSPEEMAKLSRTGPDSMAAEGTGPSHVGVSPHLLAALVRFPLLPMTLHACSLFHRLTISVFMSCCHVCRRLRSSVWTSKLSGLSISSTRLQLTSAETRSRHHTYLPIVRCPNGCLSVSLASFYFELPRPP
jgi:hypothetical protein